MLYWTYAFVYIEMFVCVHIYIYIYLDLYACTLRKSMWFIHWSHAEPPAIPTFKVSPYYGPPDPVAEATSSVDTAEPGDGAKTYVTRDEQLRKKANAKETGKRKGKKKVKKGKKGKERKERKGWTERVEEKPKPWIDHSSCSQPKKKEKGGTQWWGWCKGWGWNNSTCWGWCKACNSNVV